MTCLSYTKRSMRKHRPCLTSIGSLLIIITLVTYINHVYRPGNSGNQHLQSARKSVRSNFSAAVIDSDVDEGAILGGEPMTTNTDANVSSILDAFTSRNQLPNYFIHGNAPGLGEKYRSGNVVFVHNVKTGGTTIKNGITKMCRDRNIPMFRIGSKTRSRDRMDMLKKYETQGETPKQTILAGGGTLGICEFLRGRPCSYFTMVREPVARLVSSYLFCKQRGTACSKSSVNVPINAWVLNLGSKLFHNLFNNFGVHFPLEGVRARFHNRSAEFMAFAEPLQRAFPDIVTGRQVEYRMTSNERHAFLNYCLDNMENWFAVIGLTEDFDASVDLYQEVYRLPFKDYYQGAVNVGQVKKRMDTFTIDKMKEELRANPLIMEVLYEDLKIYEKAEEIMKKQIKASLGRF